MSPGDITTVLYEMSLGLTNEEIGVSFGVSSDRVEKYLSKYVYPMLGCVATAASVKRAEAVGRAYRMKMLP